MQSKTKHSNLIRLAFAVAVVALLSSAFLFMNPLKARAIETLPSFEVANTAEVRVRDFVGIRFTVNVGESVKEETASLTNVTYGTLLIPADLLGEEELSLQTSNVLNIETETWANESQTAYNAVLAGGKDGEGNYTDLSEEYYNRPLTARGYVKGMKESKEVVYYTTNTVTKSLGYVAAMNVEAETEFASSEIIQGIYEKTAFAFDVPNAVSLGIGTNKDQLLYNTESSTADVKLLVGGIEAPLTYSADVTGSAASFINGKVTAQAEGNATASFSYTKVGDSTTVNHALNVTVGEFTPASDYAILVPDGTMTLSGMSNPVKFAAKTFQQSFLRATGIELAILNETGAEEVSGKYIAIGATALANKNSITVSNPKSGASQISVLENTVFILGNSETGTLIGTQKFMEDILGYNYFASGLYTVENATSAIAKPLNTSYTPDISVSITPSSALFQNDELRNYYAMTNWYSNIAAVNGTQIHNTFSIVPPFSSNEKNGNGTYTSSAGNFANHPEWYTYKQNLLSSSSLTYSDSGRQTPYELCFNARGDAGEYSAMVTTAVNTYKAALMADSNINRFAFSVRDNTVWCQCNACKNENPTDSMLGFLNDVCAGIRAYLTSVNDPRANTFRMIFLAYNSVERAPSASLNLDDYIDVWFADSFGVYTIPLSDPTLADGTAIGYKNTYENFMGWANYIRTQGTVKEFLVWTYNSNSLNLLAPYDSFDAMRANYRLFAQNGVTAVYNCTNGGQSAWTSLKDYLAYKLSYNANPTNSEWDGWINAYFTAMYGNGATAMKNWFNAYLTYADTINNKFNIPESLITDKNNPRKDSYNASIYLDVTNSEFFSQAALNQWLGFANNALLALDKSDANYNLHSRSIRLERLSPLYLLLEIYGKQLPAVTYNDYALTFVTDATELGIENVSLNKSITSALEKYSEVKADLSVYAQKGSVTLDPVEIFGINTTVTSVLHGTEELLSGSTVTLNSEGTYILKVTAQNGSVKFVEVIVVTKIINTFEDLKTLAFKKDGPNITGHYILGGDIDAKGGTISGAYFAWNQHGGFIGTFDGRGYTISNFSVSGYGIFGTLGLSTIQNVNFEGVTLTSGSALLARHGYNTTISNVNVQYKAIDAGAKGLLFDNQTGAGTKLINVTLDASNLTVPNALGNQVNLSADENGVRFENVAVFAKEVTLIGQGGNGANVTATIAEWPAGITFTEREDVTVDVNTEILTDSDTFTLISEYFTVGKTFTVNGEDYTVSKEGELTVTVANLTVGINNTVTAVSGNTTLNFNNVFAVTKIIKTADDIKALSLTVNPRITGYYVLNDDIDCDWTTIQGGSTTKWNQNSGFGGIFDGRGYTIKRFSVSGYGIFGCLGTATVKNVNFELVTLNAGAPLLARTMYNSTIENVTVKLNDYKSTSGECGIFVSRQTGTSSILRNITVDANNLAIYNILGCQFDTATTVINYRVKNTAEVTFFGTSDTAGAVGIAQPAGLILDVKAELNSNTFAVAENGAATVDLRHERFAVGDTLSVTLNEIIQTLTVNEEGKLTLTLADFGVSAFGQYTFVVDCEAYKITFTEVWNVTKVIKTADDIKALSNAVNPRITGYYVLNGDIDCGWANNFSGAISQMDQNKGFGGTFDGRGYTIKRFTVIGYGIFGCLGQATVKNVNFELVTLNAGAALLARTMYNSTIENVTVKLNDYKSTSGECGVLISRQTSTNSILKNITIDANNLAIYNVLGREFNTSTTTVTNFTVINASSITYYGTSDVSGTTAIAKPEGLTTNVAALN